MGESKANPWAKELDDLIRAFSGAFLFGVPLLYTMEMWWLGELIERWKLLLFLGLAFLVNMQLAYFSGFKQETTFSTTVNQAVEAMAVGAVASTIVLLVLNQIAFGDPLDSMLGKVILQIIPLSIGASVTNFIFRRGEDRQGATDEPQQSEGQALLRDIGATVVGGIFISFSIAPTDEVPMLAAEMTYWHELALIGLSLALTYAIVFASEFSRQRGKQTNRGPFQRPISETAFAYMVSLLVALTALYFFDQVDWGDPLPFVVSQTLVLGLPTAIGGAAGRLVI